MTSEPVRLPDAPARAAQVASLLGRLAELESGGHLTAGEAGVIRRLAGRPPEMRTVRCPACLPGLPFDVFRAETDEELFALVAGHVMRMHNGGGVDAFCAAESVLPHVGLAYRKDAEERPWLYRPAKCTTASAWNEPLTDGSTPARTTR
jgi:hypothetical protein